MCRDNEIDLQLGLRKGILFFIDEVDRGLGCDCFCPHCGSRLIARKGELNRHHFAHYNADNCGKGVETALHLLGKQILLAEKQLRLPYSDQPIELSALESERQRFGYVADVGAVIASTGEEIDIEIKVTHGVNDDKRASVIQHKAAMVEIDLSDMLVRSEITREIVTDRVINSAQRIWIQADTQDTNNSEDNTIMKDKYLVVGFKSVSGYSKKYQSNFETDRLHVLIEQERRPTRNYQIHSIAGYEQQNVPIKLTPALIERLEHQRYPAWADLEFDTQLVNGTPKILVTDICF